MTSATTRGSWRYRLPLWIFAACVLIMAAKTAGGTIDWLLNTAIPSGPSPITTIYAPTQVK